MFLLNCSVRWQFYSKPRNESFAHCFLSSSSSISKKSSDAIKILFPLVASHSLQLLTLVTAAVVLQLSACTRSSGLCPFPFLTLAEFNKLITSIKELLAWGQLSPHNSLVILICYWMKFSPFSLLCLKLPKAWLNPLFQTYHLYSNQTDSAPSPLTLCAPQILTLVGQSLNQVWVPLLNSQLYVQWYLISSSNSAVVGIFTQ